MGYAHGQLMKEKAQHLIDDVWAYMEQEIVSGILSLSHVQRHICRNKLLMVQ